MGNGKTSCGTRQTTDCRAMRALAGLGWFVQGTRWNWMRGLGVWPPPLLLTLPETNSKRHLKMDGWNTFSFPFGSRPIFRYDLLVSGSVSFWRFFLCFGKPLFVFWFTGFELLWAPENLAPFWWHEMAPHKGKYLRCVVFQSSSYIVNSFWAIREGY